MTAHALSSQGRLDRRASLVAAAVLLGVIYAGSTMVRGAQWVWQGRSHAFTRAGIPRAHASGSGRPLAHETRARHGRR